MKRPDAGGASFITRVLDAAAVVVLIGGAAWLLIGPGPARAPVVFPPMSLDTSAYGGKSIVVDRAALDAAFERAGLPEPPDLNGGDPVPVGVLMGFARRWAESRDVASLGALGQVYQALEEHEPALGCFAAAARLDPDNARWTYGLGAECQALHLDDAAIAALHRAAELDPEYPTTWARLGTLHLERGELERAERCFRRFQELDDRHALGLIGLGRIELARGNATAAEGWLRQAVQTSPLDFMAHRFLGRAYAASSRPDLARRQQQVADRLPQYVGWLQFDPWLNEAHQLANTQRYLNNMLRLAAGNGEWPTAMHLCQQLLERRPDDWNTLANLTRIYRALERFDDARRTIDRALALAPDNADLHVAAAEVAFKRDAYDEASRSIDRALSFDADHTGAWELRARVLHLQGRSGDAVAAVRHTLEIDPDRSSARLVLALILREQGREAEAISVLRGLLDRDPANIQARQMLRSLGAG